MNKRPYLSKIILWSAIGLGLFYAATLAMADTGQIFVIKNYGKFTPVSKGHCDENPKVESPIILDNVHKSCSITYLTPIVGSIRKSVRAYIIYYHDKKYIKNDLMLEIISAKERGFIEGQDRFSGEDILSGCTKTKNGNCYSRWVSNNKLVTISTLHTDIPEQLLQDYKNLMPPTVTFKREDFDVQKVMHKALEKRFEHIYLRERSRGWINRYIDKEKELYLMLSQCEHERYIRCALGMTSRDRSIGCATTLILDDSDREEKWKELHNQARTRDIELSNISWEHPDRVTCPRKENDIERKIRSMLDID